MVGKLPVVMLCIQRDPSQFGVGLMNSTNDKFCCVACEFSILCSALPSFLNAACVLQEGSTKKKGRNKEGEYCGVTFLSTL